MQEQTLKYAAGEVTGHGHLARLPSQTPQPGIVIFHAFRGQDDLERRYARDLAAEGYVVLAADSYGGGSLATDAAEARALMNPLVQDRQRLRARLEGAVQALRAAPGVDPSRIAVMGFCFGGLCALEVARSGLDVRGAVALHGLLHRGGAPTADRIPAKVLVLHGYDDPMAKPDAVLELSQELTAAGADWQIHMYGGTLHAFTNPGAANPAAGTVYNATAARRANESLRAFFNEVLR